MIKKYLTTKKSIWKHSPHCFKKSNKRQKHFKLIKYTTYKKPFIILQIITMTTRKSITTKNQYKKPIRDNKKRQIRFRTVKIWSLVKFDNDDRYIKEFYLDWFIRIENDKLVNRHVQSLDDEFLDQQKILLAFNNERWK